MTEQWVPSVRYVMGPIVYGNVETSAERLDVAQTGKKVDTARTTPVHDQTSHTWLGLALVNEHPFLRAP